MILCRCMISKPKQMNYRRPGILTIPELSAEEVTIYIDILSDAISSWEGEKMRDFDVFFRLEDKQRIEELLKLTK